ncbi:SDR family NAD(P)-dependent oxidoreductase [Nannocystaceae bacterium ST9]
MGDLGKTTRTALITGASSGIGAALARALARQGIEVVIAARREAALRELASTIEAEGGKARVLALDVREPEATVEAIQAIDAELGGLDLVVANAGVGQQRWAGKLDWQACSQVIDVNVRGAVATLVAVLPKMVERGRGRLVGISSVAQYRGLPKNAAYSASKAFLSTFLESLRVDLRRTGVSVTDVRPGFVDTPLSAAVPRKPFEIDADAAARLIVDAVDRRRRVLVFPLPMRMLGALLTVMPAAIYEPIVGGATKK